MRNDYNIRPKAAAGSKSVPKPNKVKGAFDSDMASKGGFVAKPLQKELCSASSLPDKM